MRTTGLIRENYGSDAMRIARERTGNHVLKMNMIDFDLRQLAVNCYLQGVYDTAQALFETGWNPPQETTVTDYQI